MNEKMIDTRMHTVYDRVFKRGVSLSNRSTINMINGLYDRDYPLDSEVTYNWTENVKDDLHRTLADTIITINGTDGFHLEAQMTRDNSIVMRVFEYGYGHAQKHILEENTLHFPKPVVIYLYENHELPEYVTLKIVFDDEQVVEYRVPVIRYLGMSVEELNKRKLITLIPFQLLRLRREIEKERTPENIQALKTLIQHDIIDSIKQNVAAGNLTVSEGIKLRQMTRQLYHHIYEGYEELKEGGVNQMVDDALILDIDIIEHDHKLELEKKDTALKEKNKILKEKNKIIRNMISRFQSDGKTEEEILVTTGLSKEAYDELMNP